MKLQKWNQQLLQNRSACTSWHRWNVWSLRLKAAHLFCMMRSHTLLVRRCPGVLSKVPFCWIIFAWNVAQMILRRPKFCWFLLNDVKHPERKQTLLFPPAKATWFMANKGPTALRSIDFGSLDFAGVKLNQARWGWWGEGSTSSSTDSEQTDCRCENALTLSQPLFQGVKFLIARLRKV